MINFLKKALKWGFLGFAGLFAYIIIGGILCGDSNDGKITRRNPLGLKQSEVRNMRGDTFSVDIYDRFGIPELSSLSDEEFWVAYFDSANVSMIVNKDKDKILYCDFGRNSAVNFFKAEKKKERQRKEKEKERVRKLFSSWDGSHREFVKKTKARLKDPDSFEHIETRFKQDGDIIKVYMEYRARNSFNGMVVNNTVADILTADGSLIRIVE